MPVQNELRQTHLIPWAHTSSGIDHALYVPWSLIQRLGSISPVCSADQATNTLNAEPMLYWPWIARLVNDDRSGSSGHCGWPSSPQSGPSLRISNSSRNLAPLMSWLNQ